MLPPPLAGLGSIFTAGWSRGTVWELKLEDAARETETALVNHELIKEVKLAWAKSGAVAIVKNPNPMKSL